MSRSDEKCGADLPVAIVTGSSSGIGAEVAKIAAAHGFHVVINYNSNREGAEQVAKQCQALFDQALFAKAATSASANTTSTATLVVQADVANDADCRALAQAALDNWGRIDVLVNNAGTTKFCPHGDLEGLSADDFQQLYQVNTVGAFQMIRAVAPSMKASGGRIVNVASVAGLLGVGTSLAYACSKAAMLAMNKSMARELGPQILVNAVCPGFVEGAWLREGLGDELYELVKQHYLTQSRTDQVMTAETVAKNIWFFATESQNITGEHLLMDGGATLPY